MIRTIELKLMISPGKSEVGFSLEVYYITHFLSNFFRKNQQLKDCYKDLRNENKRHTLIILLGEKEYSINDYPNEKTITCRLTNQINEFENLIGQERVDKILEIILIAAHKFEFYLQGIKNTFIEAVWAFKNVGYKTIITYRKKRILGFGTAHLVMELTMERFTLWLEVFKKKENIYKRKLLDTLPHPLYYAYDFKDLIIENEEIKVTEGIYDKPFFRISLNQIKANKDGTFIQISATARTKVNLEDEYKYYLRGKI